MTAVNKKMARGFATPDTEFDTFDIMELGEFVRQLRNTVRELVRQQKRLRRAETLLTIRSSYTTKERNMLERNIQDAFQLYRNLNSDYIFVYNKTMDELRAS
jgi:hypothetical protein